MADFNQVPAIIMALFKAGAKASDFETNRDGECEGWVYVNDDELPVKGPDGVDGWFNNSHHSSAVKQYDADQVRAAVSIFFFLARLQEADLVPEDNESLKVLARSIVGEE